MRAVALVLVGVNPRRAPFLPVARSLADEGERRALLADIAGHRSVREALLVAGTGRIEVYAVVEEGVDGYDIVTASLAASGPLAADAASHGYFAESMDAASHLLAAVGGADEFAYGEEGAEPLLSAAASEARAAGSLGPQLSALVAAAQRLAGRLSAVAEEEPLSAVGETAAELARRVFDHLERRHVLLVGRSPLLEAVAGALARAGAVQFSFVGFDEDEIAGARQLGAQAAAPEALPTVMVASDIVVAAAGEGLPFVDKRLVRASMRARRNRAMLLIDASDAGACAIDGRAASMDDAFLYNGDDLAALTRETPWADLGRAPSRRAAIAEAVRDFSYQLA